MHSKQDLILQLRSLGIREGDVLLVHSSLHAVGAVEGGPQSVLDALLEAVGKSGTLMMPGFPGGGEYDMASHGICFDVRNTPSALGYLTELLRNYPGAKRSLSPTHSMTVYGAQADYLIKDHEKCDVTAGHGSPFEKLIELGGKVLMLGAARHSITLMHYLENTGGAPTLSCSKFKTTVIDMDGNVIETPIYPHMPGLSRNYSHAVDLLAEAGGLSSGKVGNADCELYDAQLLQKVAYDALKKNPCAFINVFTPPPVQ